MPDVITYKQIMYTLTVLGVNAPGLSQAQFLESLGSKEAGQTHSGESSSSVVKELVLFMFRRVPLVGEGLNPRSYGFMLVKKCDQPWYSIVDCGWASVMEDRETVQPMGSDHIIAVEGRKIGRVNFAAAGSLEDQISAQKKKA